MLMMDNNASLIQDGVQVEVRAPIMNVFLSTGIKPVVPLSGCSVNHSLEFYDLANKFVKSKTKCM